MFAKAVNSGVKKKWKFLGLGATKDPLEWKFKVGGGLSTEEPSVGGGGGYGYILEPQNDKNTVSQKASFSPSAQN